MIHENVTARGVGFVRMWTFALWAVYLSGNNVQAFANVPDLKFDPPGILGLAPDRFYDVLLTTTGLSVLKWVLLAGVIACAFGVRPWRTIAIPTVVLLTLHQGISRGLFGYINHKELGALYATYIFALFPATDFSPFAPRIAEQRSERNVASMRLMMLLLTAALLIPYCLVGVYRFSHNNMSLWSPDAFTGFIVRTSYGTTWFDNTAISEAVVTRPWLINLLTISFPIGTIIEALAPLCIVNKRFRQLWVMSMVGLHLLTWAVMDILFWENMMLYPVLLVDREFLLNKLDRLRGRVGGQTVGETQTAVDTPSVTARSA